MAGFEDAPLVRPGSELQLTIDGRAVPHDEVLADLHVLSRAGARAHGGRGGGGARGTPNLFAVAGQLAARGDAVDPAAVRGDLPLLRRLATRPARPAADGRGPRRDAIAAYTRFLET